MPNLTKEEMTLLTRTFLFRGAPEELILRWTGDERCRMTEAERGEIIYEPHRFRRCLGVLLSGRVQVTKGELLVSRLDSGDLFGAAALFNEREDYAVTLTARTRCRLLLFPQELVEEMLGKEALLAVNYIRYLSGRIRFLDRKLEGLLAGSAEQKLSRYLLEREKDGVAELEGSITSLSARLNVSRASLYRALDALTEAGIIRREERSIHILDHARLAQPMERS